ncbi:14-3-3 protein [Mollisia scopiformis]|uniref:14-3-3 protein n=1 Tax=Mollisia scopiformis TaxID=149040 RepID=A0A194XIR6_MOLSC|nr:14-3-3 protein [Mollisia scopiformis]KUJ20026.1 14-3-3 protein [Mollisia scopiformis]
MADLSRISEPFPPVGAARRKLGDPASLSAYSYASRKRGQAGQQHKFSSYGNNSRFERGTSHNIQSYGEISTFERGTLQIFLNLSLSDIAMAALSPVDLKFLGQFARNIEADNELLGKQLYKLNGCFRMQAGVVVKARKERHFETDPLSDVPTNRERIVWYAREALTLLEQYVLPMVANYTELKVLAYKLKASCYHLYVLFHNQPPIALKSAQVSTPPGLKSPRTKLDKGKGIDRGSPILSDRPSSIQPTHPLEGGPVGGYNFRLVDKSNFLIPGVDYRTKALECFQEATAFAERLLWGSHPLRLSLKVEFCAFIYDCLHDRERSRQLAAVTIAEVYNAQEGMDDEMFEDATELVAILAKMAKRGLASGRGGESAGGSSGTRTASPLRFGGASQHPIASPGMDNPI